MKKADKPTTMNEADILAFLEARDKAVSASGEQRSGLDAGSATLQDLWASMELLAEHSFPELQAYDRKQTDQARSDQSTANPPAGAVTDVAKASDNVPAYARRHKIFQRVASVAAVFIVAVGLGVGLGVGYWGIPHSYHVASGKQLGVSLDDGSNLLMQGGTDLSVSEGWGRRHVKLRNGYVFFNVAKNKNKPFTIDNGDSQVRVLGTAFAVYNTGRRLELVVEHGRVALDDTSAEQAGYQLVLTKNQKVVVDKTQSREKRAGQIKQIDPQKEFSWRRGEVYFNEQTLEDIVQRMSNFYPQPIQIMNADHRKIKLSGNYSTTDFSAFLKALALAADLRIETGPNGNILIF